VIGDLVIEIEAAEPAKMKLDLLAQPALKRMP
jgi:hypothetical protein